MPLFNIALYNRLRCRVAELQDGSQHTMPVYYRFRDARRGRFLPPAYAGRRFAGHEQKALDARLPPTPPRPRRINFISILSHADDMPERWRETMPQA